MSDDLTLTEAALVIGGTSRDAARKKIDRAIREGRLKYHRRDVGGHSVKCVYRADLVLWRSSPDPRELAADALDMRDMDMDTDDTIIDVDASPGPDGHGASGRTQDGERLPATPEFSQYMRTLQTQAEALREANERLSGQVQTLQDRLDTAQRERVQAVERAARAEGEAVELRRERAERAERRSWWARLWSGDDGR